MQDTCGAKMDSDILNMNTYLYPPLSSLNTSKTEGEIKCIKMQLEFRRGYQRSAMSRKLQFLSRLWCLFTIFFFSWQKQLFAGTFFKLSIYHRKYSKTTVNVSTFFEN